MNMKDIDHWDATHLRAAAARERALALRELGAHLSAWLRSWVPARAGAKPRECLDCGA